ncbi:MAG: alanine--glyoxylate aminotransferase family protein [bacterium]|nr:alanine--glyoxylate aminotransferase family protein [bacterium]
MEIKRVNEQIAKVRLHGPGPSDVPASVLDALSARTIGHLDPDFLRVMDQTQEMLRAVFQTKNRMTIPVSGTGSSGMEALVANLVEPGDRVAVVRNGVFGGRIADEIARFGGEVLEISLEWGTTVEPEQVKKALSSKKCQALFLVHAETSTGAHQQHMKEIADIVHEHGAIFLVDCVTSLGGAEVKVDEWGIDAAYSGTQKCLSVPPGLAPITLNERAMEKLRKRETPVQSWYFDLTMIEQYWTEGVSRKYHHTAPVNMIFALHEGLRLILEEGLEAVFERHRKNAAALQAGLESLGLRYVVEKPEHRLPMLHAVFLPEGHEEGKLRKRLRTEFKVEVGGGLGEFAGKAWRVGLMGHSSREEKVQALLRDIQSVLCVRPVGPV